MLPPKRAPSGQLKPDMPPPGEGKTRRAKAAMAATDAPPPPASDVAEPRRSKRAKKVPEVVPPPAAGPAAATQARGSTAQPTATQTAIPNPSRRARAKNNSSGNEAAASEAIDATEGKRKRARKEPKQPPAIAVPLESANRARGGTRKRKGAAADDVAAATAASPLDQQSRDRVVRALAQRLYLIDHEVSREAGPRGAAAECLFHVLGASGNVYKVTVGRSPRCSCPDHAVRKNTCKHLLFVMLRVLGLSVDDPLVFARALSAAVP